MQKNDSNAGAVIKSDIKTNFKSNILLQKEKIYKTSSVTYSVVSFSKANCKLS
jgi:hypothetical protein